MLLRHACSVVCLSSWLAACQAFLVLTPEAQPSDDAGNPGLEAGAVDGDRDGATPLADAPADSTAFDTCADAAALFCADFQGTPAEKNYGLSWNDAGIAQVEDCGAPGNRCLVISGGAISTRAMTAPTPAGTWSLSLKVQCVPGASATSATAAYLSFDGHRATIGCVKLDAGTFFELKTEGPDGGSPLKTRLSTPAGSGMTELELEVKLADAGAGAVAYLNSIPELFGPAQVAMASSAPRQSDHVELGLGGDAGTYRVALDDVRVTAR